jgi:hypothetical protein
LADLYNHILQTGIVPELLATSLIVPLVKSYKKSLSNPNNYRGISLVPILTKILEILVLHKYPQLTDSSDSQFGFKKNSSTLHAEYLITETVKYYNQNKSPVYICSLDAEKAFDSCHWPTLFIKLRDEKNLPCHVIKVLQSLYQAGTAQVFYKGIKSNTIRLTQGVRQGSILSPYLYNIYTNYLLEKIRNKKIGTVLANHSTSITSYADDIILMSATLRGLQEMIDTCINYGYENGIKFNPTKTEFIISGQPTMKNITLNIDGTDVLPTKSLKHLGFHWMTHATNISSINKSHLEHRINDFRAASAALITSGIRFLHPNSISTLYQSLLIPRLLYGLELCHLNKTDISRLEVIARSSLKSLFDVSKFSRNYLNLSLGIRSIADIIYERKLSLLVRLLQNGTMKSIILNQLSAKTYTGSFIEDVAQIIDKHNINVIDLIMTSRFQILETLHDVSDIDYQNVLKIKEIFHNWCSLDNRMDFKTMMEENIPR